MTTKTEDTVVQTIDIMVMQEVERLAQASKEGDLRARADVSRFTGDAAQLLTNLNAILDEALGPVDAQAEVLARMAKGDLSAKITADFKGDHNRIKDAINAVANIASTAQTEIVRIIDASKAGNLQARADVDTFIGNWKEIMTGLNTILDEALGPVNTLVDALDAMATGALSTRITEDFKGDHNRGKRAINAVANIASAAQTEIMRIIDASKAGNLQARADVDTFIGDWKEIMTGLNTILDEALSPIEAQVELLEKMVNGDLNARITMDLKGDHNRIKDLMNSYQDFNQQVVEDIVQVSERLSEGDLQATLRGRYMGDFVRIKEALETAISGLNSTIGQVNAVVEQVAQAVEQVRSVSQDLASNAEEQSSAVEEVTSNLEETNSQVKANAENTGVANQVVNETASVANTGQEKMKLMTEAMNAIAASSREIAKIIKVIDEIAFQTNLLALNAAVEAARAGQHGRGFAVVAQEVRNLAGRSAKAAKETAELIEDATRRVEGGVANAAETAAALTEIVSNVVKVKDLVAEIAAASDEQTTGITQINNAMLQVNQGAQASSQQSEELASTADELGNLADRLREEAGRFRLQQQKIHAGGEGLPAGITPEVMHQIMEILKREQTSFKAGPGAAKPAAGKAKSNGVKHELILPLDRDDRGYQQF